MSTLLLNCRMEEVMALRCTPWTCMSVRKSVSQPPRSAVFDLYRLNCVPTCSCESQEIESATRILARHCYIISEECGLMNAVGIDVSKGRSTVAVARPFGETIVKPFEVPHTKRGIESLVNILNALEGECRVVLEHTGRY